MRLLGFPMMVTDGFRTQREQQMLYAMGRTRPGKIVTYADGVTKKSAHQSGRALDCAFLVDVDGDGAVDDPTWDLKRPWRAYGENAKALGFIWGGDWKSLIDLPHIELP